MTWLCNIICVYIYICVCVLRNIFSSNMVCGMVGGKQFCLRVYHDTCMLCDPVWNQLCGDIHEFLDFPSPAQYIHRFYRVLSPKYPPLKTNSTVSMGFVHFVDHVQTFLVPGTEWLYCSKATIKRPCYHHHLTYSKPTYGLTICLPPFICTLNQQ